MQIKSLILTFLQDFPVETVFSAAEIADLRKFSDIFDGSAVQLSINITQAIEKIENFRQASFKEQEVAVEKSIFKHETLALNVIDTAMRVTREVGDIQNKERSVLINYIRKLQGLDFHKEWMDLIKRMTSEGAPWYCKDLYSNSWEVDNTEGPDKCRRRFKRCVLKVRPRFFLEDFNYKAGELEISLK